MTSSSRVFRVGTRASRLAEIQAKHVVTWLQTLSPTLAFEVIPHSSPGDRDRNLDLRKSPDDFFTRDLDRALLGGEIDLAVHSAKDVAVDEGADLGWCWLPVGEDPRDAWVLPTGRGMSELGRCPRIGISSQRREEYARHCFPDADIITIRGDIEQRLELLDSGPFDAIIMAGAALIRLDLSHRITSWIPLDALPVPDGQGRLCITFRRDDPRVGCIRRLCLRTSVIVGAGAGSASLCTVGGLAALRRCDVCLHDALIDPDLLRELPDHAPCIAVGKRARGTSVPQATTTQLLLNYVRRGHRVVRLKGGDPGVFGRLADEIEALESHQLPYRVIPGVSSLASATTGTGMLLTRRGEVRGFCAVSARDQSGGLVATDADARLQLPLVAFMASGVIDELVKQLLADGLEAHTPAAMVFDAGAVDTHIERGDLSDIGGRVNRYLRHCQACGAVPPPGLFIVGDAARHGFRTDCGALGGRRVLLTCSDELLGAAESAVMELGGIPLRCPLVRLEPISDVMACVALIATFDWVVLASPTAARILLSALASGACDARSLPRLAVSGPGTAAVLGACGLHPELCPDRNCGTEGMLGAFHGVELQGKRVLRLRADRSSTAINEALESMGAEVDDRVLYRNQRVEQAVRPTFDAVFFASQSAVEAFVDQWGVESLDDALVTAIGNPTAEALRSAGVRDMVIPDRATVVDAIQRMAGAAVAADLEGMA